MESAPCGFYGDHCVVSLGDAHRWGLYLGPQPPLSGAMSTPSSIREVRYDRPRCATCRSPSCRDGPSEALVVSGEWCIAPLAAGSRVHRASGRGFWVRTNLPGKNNKKQQNIQTQKICPGPGCGWHRRANRHAPVDLAHACELGCCFVLSFVNSLADQILVGTRATVFWFKWRLARLPSASNQ